MILSGGAASRAGGVNKSFLPVKGGTVLGHQLERIGRIVPSDKITVVTDRPKDYERFKLRCVTDVRIGGKERTAMRGLCSALARASQPWVFVLANDMPWPDPEILISMWTVVREHKPLGVCLCLKNGLEPMHAIYSSALADTLRERIRSAGKARVPQQGHKLLSIQGWLASQQGILKLTARDLKVSDRRLALACVNINTVPEAGKPPAKR